LAKIRIQLILGKYASNDFYLNPCPVIVFQTGLEQFYRSSIFFPAYPTVSLEKAKAFIENSQVAIVLSKSKKQCTF